jgi:hypothetical protein
MIKCETRKQLSYSRLGTGIFQENGGLNQVLRRIKPHTSMTDINSSVILTKGGWQLIVTSREYPVVK